ncbi:MAG: hypothetical protein AAF602_10780, partial [Myxococcota bacterium]
VRPSELGDADALALIEAFLARRLIVRKGQGDTSTVEVAHEALLRRWPRLVALLEADRDGLLLLDGVLEASEEWSGAPETRRDDYLMHRGSRLDDAVALADRGPEWQRELEPARGYLQAARSADDALREQQRRDFARRRGLQRALISVLSVVLVGVLGLAAWLVVQTREVNRETSEVLAASAEAQVRDGAFDSALRLAMTAADSPSWLSPATGRAGSVLAHAAYRNRLRVAASTGARVTRAELFRDATRLLTHRPSDAVQIWTLATGELIRELPHPADVISARLIDARRASSPGRRTAGCAPGTWPPARC